MGERVGDGERTLASACAWSLAWGRIVTTAGVGESVTVTVSVADGCGDGVGVTVGGTAVFDGGGGINAPRRFVVGRQCCQR